MTPTLCHHCGWHVGRCRCAAVRARAFAEAADHMLDCARVVRRRFGAYDDLARVYDDKADYFATLAERALAHHKGDA